MSSCPPVIPDLKAAPDVMSIESQDQDITLANLNAGNFTIHVPQGGSARLTCESLEYGFTGLFTCGVSTCCIIAMKGKDKIILMHVDPQVTDAIEIINEIQWVNEQNEIIFMYREQWKEVLASELSEMLNKRFPGRLASIRIEDDCDGIYISFDSSRENVPTDLMKPYIRKFAPGKMPTRLLMHPQEQKILAVRKIQQLIGCRARKKNQGDVHLLKIFDGCAWEAILPHEMSVDDSDPLTSEELGLFNSSDLEFIIREKLKYIHSHIHTARADTMEQSVLSTAPYLESYLNNYDDAIKLLKRNLESLLHDKDGIYSEAQPATADDHNIVKKMKEFLLANGKFEQIEPLFSDYRQHAPDTAFKKILCQEFSALTRDYLDRMRYTRHTTLYRDIFNSVSDFNKQAIKLFSERNYLAATNLFQESLRRCSYCCSKDCQQLASSYYNLGRSLQMNQQYQKAVLYLQTALTLQNDYHPSNLQQINKIKNALAECTDKLGTLADIPSQKSTKFLFKC